MAATAIIEQAPLMALTSQAFVVMQKLQTPAQSRIQMHWALQNTKGARASVPWCGMRNGLRARGPPKEFVECGSDHDGEV
jgi:hypothetical protein